MTLVASRVAAAPISTPSRTGTPVLQRCPGGCPVGGCDHEDDLRLQRRGVGYAPSIAPPLVGQVLRSLGRQLDATTKSFMEEGFGHDFSRVVVHADPQADAAARSVGALAFTVGSHVVLGSAAAGDTSREAGRRILAHELAHVVQQDGGQRGRDEVPDRLAIVDDASHEDEAEAVARAVMSGRRANGALRLSARPRGVSRIAEPYITKVTVNLNPPESASLEWKGTAPSEPGKDSFTVSTGKGYGDPDDPPGTCTRSCCSDADTQCAPPHDKPEKIGSCCTPIGNNFWTGTPRDEHNGWKHWTPVEPIHTAGHRGIALHQHTEVTGQAIGHGCIRMEEGNADRIHRYSRGRDTTVVITGRAKVSCPDERKCGRTGAAEQGETETRLAEVESSLTNPDEEAPA